MKQLNEKYKLSLYNVFHDEGDVRYMWNTYSNALLKLDKNAQEYIHTFSGIDDNSNDFKLLKNNGFIVYDKLDEYGRVRVEEKQVMFAPVSETIAFVIAPGTGCNYSCSYCFEAKSDLTRVMTSEIAVEVAEYICLQLKKHLRVKEINVYETVIIIR